MINKSTGVGCHWFYYFSQQFVTCVVLVKLMNKLRTRIFQFVFLHLPNSH